jgi:ABC-2 type transport system ATP-binding protein
MLRAENLTKRYGDHTAVENVSFLMEPGKTCGLIGPNGAGKSTTIRMILGIIEPDEGTIEGAGTDPNRIGYLPEERGLYRKEKLNEVLLYLAALKGCPKTVAQPRIDQWLERFGLTEWKQKKIDTLSKGMAQKAQFISTIIHDPDVVILDEPFSGLDPVSADELLAVIRELKAAGKLVLFSTHVMEQAEKVCDHVIMLNKGKKILDGDLRAIRKERGEHTVTVSFADTKETPSDNGETGPSGDAAFLANLPSVASARDEGTGFLVTLAPNATSDDLLSALAGKRSVTHFAVNEPSLHAIFVELAGNGSNTTAREDAK